jgi:uncharacterized protein YndB with AHSA1/START domain
MTGCDVDLRVGGAYRYVWRHENGELLELNGSFREIVPPSRIVSTETFGDDWTAGATVVTLEFTEVAGGTELTTTVLFSSAEARDAGVATGMTEGMGMGYERLDALLAELS